MIFDAPSPIALETLRNGGKRAMAQALAFVEAARGAKTLADLLDAAAADPRAHVIGLTGPPGVGKSTLANALVKAWRSQDESVGVLAVDPSSRVSGGALLGDRARFSVDPEDKNVFIRSMAARDRLGGLSDDAIGAMVLMRAVFARVLIESVGIGQSEADVSFAADSVVLCIQPGSGDSLQFMKAGVMELPDIVVVTKADMGAPALRAKTEVEGAIGLFARADDWRAPVILASAASGQGFDELLGALESHRAYLGAQKLRERRDAQQDVWVSEKIKTRFGAEGFRAVQKIAAATHLGPFAREQFLTKILRDRLAVL